MAREAELRPALRRVWPEAAAFHSVDFEPLGGGVLARSFLVAHEGRRRVLRLPGRAPAPLDFPRELRAMRAAAAAGLAPPVVAADVEAGLLLTEYHAAAWTAEQARRPANIARIAASLRALHALAVELPSFVAADVAEALLRSLAAQGGLGRPDGSRADEFRALARRYDAQHGGTAFCHNDLFAANVLDDGAQLKLIDFEYAVGAAPILDLAGLAGLNDFAPPERRELLAAYYVGAEPAATIADLDDAVRLVRLMAYFWARLGAVGAMAGSAHAALAAKLGEALE